MKVTRDDYMQAFGKRFKQAMESLNVDIYAFGARADVSPTVLYKYMKGKAIPSAFTLAKICHVGRFDANKLLGFK